VKLTDRSVAALVCPPGRKDALVFDEDLTGFAVRVTATGSKTFLLQYKIAGTRRRLSIAEFPATPAARARRAAEVARGQVKSGHDPWAARRLEQCASKQTEATARAQAARNALTFGVLIASLGRKGAFAPARQLSR
jgi:Arm DNA-binding domain